MKCPSQILLVLALALGVFAPQDADACSRVLWSTENAQPVPGQTPPTSTPVIVGRTEDWLTTLNNKFRVFPIGISRDGLAGTNSLSWTSKYGSLVLTILDVGTHEGMNEQGLSARMLYLGATDYGLRDETRPGLVVTLWPQYILDNFASVAEAVQSLTAMNVQVLPIKLQLGAKAPFHLSIEDASGDSAIIEIINGQMQVHYGYDPKYSVWTNAIMTNDPTYDEQLAKLDLYIAEGFKTLPGGLTSEDRFVRAYYYATQLYQPQDQYQAVSFMFSLLGNISVPFAVNPDDYPTWWRSVMDLTNRVYFFGSTLRPNVVWVDMAKLDFSVGASERGYDVEWGPDLSGDISDSLEIAEKFKFKDSSPYPLKGYIGVLPAVHLLLGN